MDSARRFTYKAGSTVLGGQEIINLDPFARQIFNASFHVDLVSGTMSVRPEYTMDDVTGDPAALRWHPLLTDALTKTTLFGILDAVTAVRLNIDSITGEIRLSVIQGVGR
jgi:hypothetical protein